MKALTISAMLLFLVVPGCKKCYFCGGSYNGDICTGNPEIKSITRDSTGQYVYNGIRGNYVCVPE